MTQRFFSTWFSIFGVLFFLQSGLVAWGAQEPEISVIFRDETGHYFKLEPCDPPTFNVLSSRFWDVRNRFKWVPVSLEQVRSESIAGSPHHYRYSTGELRLKNNRRTAQFRYHSESRWFDFGHKVDARSFVLSGMMDRRGDIILRYDSDHQGAIGYYFKALSQGRSEPFPINVDNTFGMAKHRVGNPYGRGFFIEFADGTIQRVEPPRRKKRSDANSYEVVPAGSVSDLVGAYNRLFVLQNGAPAVMNNKGRLIYLPFPKGVEPSSENRLYSSAHFKADEPIPSYLKNLPADQMSPEDMEKFLARLEEQRQELRRRVIDQGRYTDTLIDAWRDANLAKTTKRRVKVILVTGPTGVGKTYGAEEFSEVVLGSKERVLEIDGTQYQGLEGSLDHHRLVGAAVGTEGQKNFKGILPEFLRGRGRGKNVIIINEYEKMALHVQRMFMEMMDTGRLQSGDGQTDELGISIIILTSNKGDNKIFPPGRGKILRREELEKRLTRFTDDQVKEFFMEPAPDETTGRKKIVDRAILMRIYKALVVGPVSIEGAQILAEREFNLVTQDYSTMLKFEPQPEVFAHIVKAAYTSPENGIRNVEKKVSDFVGTLAAAVRKNLDGKPIDTVEVKLISDEDGDAQEILVTNKRNNQTISLEPFYSDLDVAAYFAKSDNREHLASLENLLGKHVFGQPAALHMAAKAIRARRLNPHSGSSTSMLFLGPTGVGKTELGKAIAEVEFGSAERHIAIDLGAVKTVEDLNNIFNPPKGFVGATEPTPFERFLMDFPEGGVIIFDEVGNMGTTVDGRSPTGVKENILKRFYRIIDEAQWTSSQGKTYDLSKFVLVFTSNEGQKLLNSLPTDDLRMAVWEKVNRKEILEQLLVREHGWPEPFIARFHGNLTLFKPVMAADRRRIAGKLVNNAVSNLFREHRVRQPLVASEDFFNAMGESFFSHARGARSMKGMAQESLTDLLGTAIMDGYSQNNVRQSIYNLGLQDNYHGKYRFKGDFPSPRKVILTVKRQYPDVNNPEQKIETVYQADLTADAPEVRLTSSRDLQRFAIHEAGHTVANDPLLTMEVVDFVTVRAAGGMGGYARYRDLAPKGAITRRQAIALLGRLLAGGQAEVLMGLTTSSGWSNDLERARQLAESSVSEYGLTEKALGLPTKEGRVDITHPRVQQEIEEILKEGQQFARHAIEARWLEFRLLVARLIKQGHIDAKGVQEIYAIAQDPDYRNRAVVRLPAKLAQNIKPRNCLENLQIPKSGADQ